MTSGATAAAGALSGSRSRPPLPSQEDDVIGVLTTSEKIAELTPLGDRILIKVSTCTPMQPHATRAHASP
jgi:hypothetical protein